MAFLYSKPIFIFDVNPLPHISSIHSFIYSTSTYLILTLCYSPCNFFFCLWGLLISNQENAVQYEEFYLWKNMEAWKKDTYTVLGLWDVFSEELKYNLNPEKQLLVRLWIASRIITRGRGSRSRNLITTESWASLGNCIEFQNAMIYNVD